MVVIPQRNGEDGSARSETTKAELSQSAVNVHIGKAKKAKESRSIKPAHVNAPVSKTDPERIKLVIKLTLQGQRLKCAQLEQQLTEMRAELLKSSVEFDSELSNDFTQILDSDVSRFAYTSFRLHRGRFAYTV